MCLTYRQRLVVLCSAALMALLWTEVRGQQESPSRFTVQGHGKVKARPTSVELMGMISAEAELAGDALTQFRTAKATALEAIQKLDVPHLTVETNGFAFGPANMNQNSAEYIINRSRGAPPEPPKVLMQEALRLRLQGIDQLEFDQLLDVLAKIVDTAKESGVTFGPPVSLRISSRDEPLTFVTFSLENPAALRAQAEEQAMREARDVAARLAKLAGAELGEIHSVQEAVSLPTSLRPSSPDQSARLDEIEVSVTLAVQFALLPRKTANADAAK